MAKEKKITQEELVKMIRGMVKEHLEKHVQKPLKENKQPATNKISVNKLREMIRESIMEVLEEEKTGAQEK